MDKIKRLISKYKLASFICLVIFVGVVLVAISMKIYYSSEAYRLDLSRPEYESRRSEIKKVSDKEVKEFDSQGRVDPGVIDDFLKIYDNETKDAFDAKAFSNEVLGDDELELRTP